MTVANPKYHATYLTINHNVTIDGIKLVIGAQYKWIQKQEVKPDNACGCGPKYWKYLVTEDADGCKLEKPIWIPESFGVEDDFKREKITQSMWDERRDDGTGINWDIPNHLREKGKHQLDKDGYYKIT